MTDPTVRTSVVTASIFSNGSPMDKSYDLLSVNVTQEVNRIPTAQIVLADGNVAEQKFAISDSSFFEPGKKIEIKLRYEDAPQEEVSVFKGFVVKQTIEAGINGTLLTVDLKGTAFKLTHARKNQVFLQKTDVDIIKELTSAAGFRVSIAKPVTKPKYVKMVQYDCTDWDFILTRAEACGLLLVADDTTLSLYPIEIPGSVAYSFTAGISEIDSFEIEADASDQFAQIQSVSWNSKEQKLTTASKAAEFSLKQGNLNGSSLAKSLGADLQTLSSMVQIEPDALQAWANGRMAQTRMSLLRGRMSVPGLGKIKCMDGIKLAGVGSRFNGTTFVSGIRHQVGFHGWQTDIQFGLSAQRVAEKFPIADAPAAGLLPPVSGLQVGIVSALADPDKEMRVQVRLPGLGDSASPIWARFGLLYAGKNHGMVFMPEIGDEVILGFFNNDPTQPVVLGSMFSAKNTAPKLPAEIDDKNQNKAIVTAKGLSITFTDADKPKIIIQTPAKNIITLDDEQEMVKLTDKSGNTITMDKNGVVIKSAKDFKIDASGNVEIKGAKVDVK